MAVLATVMTPFGEERELYIRLNNFEQFPNRQPDGTYSVPAIALFRGFLSEEAFKETGGHFMYEKLVEFVPTFEGDIRAEAYAALLAQDNTERTAAELAEAEEHFAAMDEEASEDVKSNMQGLVDKRRKAHEAATRERAAWATAREV